MTTAVSTDHPLRNAALGYTRRGWAIIPLWWPVGFDTGSPSCACRDGANCSSPGKHPLATLVPRGLHDATTSPAVAARWWSRYPDANIGLVTGINFDVVDIDGAQGLASIVRWEKAGYSLVDYLYQVETGRGWHLYIKPTGRGCTAHAAPGVDYRGRGGYVVGPPSLHVSGQRYVWCLDRNPHPQRAVA